MNIDKLLDYAIMFEKKASNDFLPPLSPPLRLGDTVKRTMIAFADELQFVINATGPNADRYFYKLPVGVTIPSSVVFGIKELQDKLRLYVNQGTLDRDELEGMKVAYKSYVSSFPGNQLKYRIRSYIFDMLGWIKVLHFDRRQ